MITSGIILMIAIVALVLMMVGLMFAVISILFMYTGRSATYDRAAKKMAKAANPKVKKAKKVK